MVQVEDGEKSWGAGEPEDEWEKKGVKWGAEGTRGSTLLSLAGHVLLPWHYLSLNATSSFTRTALVTAALCMCLPCCPLS